MLLVFVCPLLSKAQSDAISFGPQVSYTFGTPLDIERTAVNTLGSNGLGTSYAHTFGAGVELHFPAIITRSIGLSLIGGYAWSIGEFTSNVFASSINSLSAPGTQQFHLSSRYGTASLTALLAYHLSPKWDAGFGAQMGLRVQDALMEWREVLSPAGAGFSNSSTIDTVPTSSSISSNPFRVAVPVFLGYSMPVGNGITLASRLFASADLNEMFAGYAAESFSAGIYFSLLFGHGTAPPRRDVPRTSPSPPHSQHSGEGRAQHVPTILPPNTIPPPAHILAAVHLEINGVAAKTASVREVDTLIETFTALPENIRVPKAESRLVRSYIVPDLSVSRFVESEEGVRGWKVRISQAGRILSEYSSADSVEQSAMSASVELSGPNGPAPILAEMTVTNVQGTIRSVWDTLSLLADTTPVASRIQRQSYLFLPRTTADLRHQDSLMLRNLLSSLDTSGSLTISPHNSKFKECPEQDSLSSFVLSAIRASSVRPGRIELLDQPANSEFDATAGDCGIIVRYVRGE